VEVAVSMGNVRWEISSLSILQLRNQKFACQFLVADCYRCRFVVSGGHLPVLPVLLHRGAVSAATEPTHDVWDRSIHRRLAGSTRGIANSCGMNEAESCRLCR